MEIISAIIGIIVFVMFIILFGQIGTINRTLLSIETILNAWAKEKGIGENYTCKNCQKIYSGRLPKCPYCGDEKVYK